MIKLPPKSIVNASFLPSLVDKLDVVDLILPLSEADATVLLPLFHGRLDVPLAYVAWNNKYIEDITRRTEDMDSIFKW